MRDGIVILVILSLIIAGSMWTHKYYETTLNEFEEKLGELENSINDEENKTDKVKEVENKWINRENILIMFQTHDAIDEIEKDLYECFHYYMIAEDEDFNLARKNVLRGIEDLIKREKLTIVNLF